MLVFIRNFAPYLPNLQPMKRTFLPLLFLAVLSFSACGGQKSGDAASTADTTEIPLATEQGPGRDDPRHLTAEAEWSGHKYAIEVRCAPDDSLARVKDRFGDEYLDNRVSVVIQRDGQPFVERTLTKADLLPHLGEANGQQLILGGMAFSSVNAQGLHFGAPLNGPGDEEGGLAFRLTLPLSGQGQWVIVRDANQDTSAGDEDVMD